MKLDNTHFVIEKHHHLGEVVSLTNKTHDVLYLLNLEQQVYADEETKTLIHIIRLLTEENKYLKKENHRLVKIHNK